jgi:ribokinase
VNKEEAALFTGKPVTTPMSQMLTAVHRLGPRIVVITDGPAGSYASDSSGQFELGIFDVPVVERTGCGDAFATGFMCAIASGKDVTEAMRWGSFESAGVLQHIGPQEGLLRKKDLDLYQRKYPDFIANEMAAYKPAKKKESK